MTSKSKLVKYILLSLGGLILIGAAVWLFVFSGFFQDKAELTVEDWGENSEITYIEFAGDTITASNNTVIISGNTITIKNAGEYQLSGSLNDGQIIVNTAKTSGVVLTLDDVSIHSSTTAPIYAKQAGELMVVSLAGTTNNLSDGNSRVSDSSINATLYADCNLTLTGKGILNITGNYAAAIKSKDLIQVSDAVLRLDSIGDGINANDVIVNSGVISAATDDDGIHADDTLVILGGDINITKSYEGLEATTITISGGNIAIVASDDGINAAGGNDATATSSNGRHGPDHFAGSTGTLNIHGGNIFMNVSGDGLDSNGDINMSGGTVIINGPTSSSNGAVDYEGTFNISGGILFAVGASGMAQAPSSSSTQNSIMFNLQSQSAGSSIVLSDTNGETILELTAAKTYSSVVVSAPSLQRAQAYTLSIDSVNLATVTLNSATTSYGSGGMGGSMNNPRR